MRCTPMLVAAGLLVPFAADASPPRGVLSLDAGPEVAIDGRFGAGGEVRGALEWAVAERVAVGGGLEVGAAAWADVGDERSGDLVGLALIGRVHVAVQLTPTLRLEPMVGFGLLHSRGDLVRGTLPAYTSTVAVVRGHLRAGVESRVSLGELDGPAGTFAPDTLLRVFIGWQS